MRFLVLLTIKFYQRHISPRKGFSCAYRVLTGHASCSTLASRAIQRHGLFRGFLILHKRFVKCGIAHRRNLKIPFALHKQAGYCDVPCDAPACDIDLSDICNGLSGCSSPSDCGNWRRSQDDDNYIHVPPNSKL